MFESNSINSNLIEHAHASPNVNIDNLEDVSTLRSNLFSGKLWSVLTYGILITFAFQQINIVSPIIGQRYFENHNNNHHHTNTTNNCASSADSTYIFWNGMFNSIGGVLGFLTQGYFGQLSDIHGRKPMLIFIWSTLFVSNAILTVTHNAWVYLALIPLSNLAGSFGGIETIFQASIADVIDGKHRTTIFAIIFGIAGIVVVVSSILTNIVQIYFNIIGVMIMFDISMILALLWLLFVYKETLILDVNIQESNKTKVINSKLKPLGSEYDNISNINMDSIQNSNKDEEKIICCTKVKSCGQACLTPFLPLLKVRENNLIFWISVVALFTGLTESGIDDILTLYCLKILDLCDADKDTSFNSFSEVALGIGLLFAQIVIVPMLISVFKVNDVQLIFVGLFIVLIFCIGGILLYFVTNIIAGYVLWFFYGMTYVTSPIMSGILSKRLSSHEQGVYLGILHAIKGITFSIAPFLFSFLLQVFNNFKVDIDGVDLKWFETMPFIVAALFILIGLLVLMHPLKRCKLIRMRQFKVLMFSVYVFFLTPGNPIYIGTLLI